VTIYISAYVEAANRDAFMAVKQDLLLAFIDCCNRNGAKLARKRTQVSQTWCCSWFPCFSHHHGSRTALHHVTPADCMAFKRC
jgi:hypothetical protein